MYVSYRNFTNNTVSTQPVKTTPKKQKEQGVKRATILAGSALGMLLGLAIAGKGQGLNPFTKKGYQDMEYGFKTMTTIAASSLVGGVGTGILLDKKEAKPKLREGLQQLVGNIIFPIAAVTQGEKFLSKYINKINVPQLKGGGVISRSINCFTKAIPKVTTTAFLLATGLFLGNKVANFVNDKIFGQQEYRKFKMSDLSCHVDDLCVAATLVTKGTNIGQVASNLIAPALIIPGYVAGTKTSKDKH